MQWCDQEEQGLILAHIYLKWTWFKRIMWVFVSVRLTSRSLRKCITRVHLIFYTLLKACLRAEYFEVRHSCSYFSFRSVIGIINLSPLLIFFRSDIIPVSSFLFDGPTNLLWYRTFHGWWFCNFFTRHLLQIHTPLFSRFSKKESVQRLRSSILHVLFHCSFLQDYSTVLRALGLWWSVDSPPFKQKENVCQSYSSKLERSRRTF